MKKDIILNMVTPEPVKCDGKTGSVVRFINILSEMKRMDNSIRIIVNSTDQMSKYCKDNGLDADFRIMESSLKYVNNLGLSIKSLFLIIRSFFVLGFPSNEEEGRNQAIYSTCDLFWEVIPSFFYRIKNDGVEWIQVVHHVYPDWKKRAGNLLNSFLGFYLQRASFLLMRWKADKIIVVSPSTKDDLIRLGFDERKIYINSNGIDLNYLNRLKKGDVAYEGVFLGRLSPSKGIYDLLHIWKKVCGDFQGARLAIIGGGEEKTKKILSEKIKKEKLEKNIDILGFLDDDKAYTILKSGKVFIFPSHEEGWGIAIAEAMACGLPVVSWDLQNYKSVFEDNTVQIEENNTELFSKKVIKLLTDENLSRALGEKGKEFIRKYSWENVARRELEIITS